MIKFIDEESPSDDVLCTMTDTEVPHLPRVGDMISINEVIDGEVVLIGHDFGPVTDLKDGYISPTTSFLTQTVYIYIKRQK